MSGLQDSYFIRDKQEATAEADVGAEVESPDLCLRGIFCLGFEVPAEDGGIEFVGCFMLELQDALGTFGRTSSNVRG